MGPPTGQTDLTQIGNLTPGRPLEQLGALIRRVPMLARRAIVLVARNQRQVLEPGLPLHFAEQHSMSETHQSPAATRSQVPVWQAGSAASTWPSQSLSMPSSQTSAAPGCTDGSASLQSPFSTHEPSLSASVHEVLGSRNCETTERHRITCATRWNYSP